MEDTRSVIVKGLLIKDFWLFILIKQWNVFHILIDASLIGAFWLFSLFAFPCVIILSPRYGKLSSNTTVFSPKEYIRIDIRCSKPLRGSLVLYPGLWILKSLVPDSGVLDPGSWIMRSWVSDLGSWGPRSQSPGILGSQAWSPGVPGPGSSF